MKGQTTNGKANVASAKRPSKTTNATRKRTVSPGVRKSATPSSRRSNGRTKTGAAQRPVREQSKPSVSTRNPRPASRPETQAAVSRGSKDSRSASLTTGGDGYLNKIKASKDQRIVRAGDQKSEPWPLEHDDEGLVVWGMVIICSVIVVLAVIGAWSLFGG